MAINVKAMAADHKRSFPKLMINRKHGVVILATDYTTGSSDPNRSNYGCITGTCLQPGVTENRVGTYSQSWAGFEDYNDASIVLVNE